MSSNLFCFLHCCLVVVSVVTAFAPVVYHHESSSQECHQPLQQDQQLMETIELVKQRLGTPGCNPPKNRSCQEIARCFPSASSGYFNIRVPNGSLVQVYCDMEGTNCGGQGGWMRVAYFNMSQPGATCPETLLQAISNGLTLCFGVPNGITDLFFSTFGLQYTRVCGQFRGYQQGKPDAFGNDLTRSIDDSYVDGVSITYGDPRMHIWTYAVGNDESSAANSSCPCNDGFPSVDTPLYVGDDFYCESGSPTGTSTGVLYSNDPLWDGKQCGNMESTCCGRQNMPWFLKSFDNPSTDDIEVRILGRSGQIVEENAPLELIELFVA